MHLRFQPSSSGRSAELLGSALPKFAGFGSNIKDTTFPLPCFPMTTGEIVDPALDSNFQLVLKKMSKKDSTTKLKVSYIF